MALLQTNFYHSILGSHSSVGGCLHLFCKHYLSASCVLKLLFEAQKEYKRNKGCFLGILSALGQKATQTWIHLEIILSLHESWIDYVLWQNKISKFK